METMRDRSKYLADKRTPNIMYNAFSNVNDNDIVTIPRGTTPRVKIPAQWLVSCWVFSNKFHLIGKL